MLYRIQQKCMYTEEIIQKWFNNIWFKYLESNDLCTDGMGYLILDNPTSHITNNIISQYSNDDKFMFCIRAVLTR